MKKNTTIGTPTEHQEKIKRFKKALEDNTYAINSDSIAAALLEAQASIKQKTPPLEEPELV